MDIFTPLVDDPYTFGQIAAANSVSDVFAMGGRPLTALAILGYMACDFGPPVIRRLLKGAVEKLNEAGACLIGGHSIQDEQFKFGFAVSGVVEKDAVLKVAGASSGDVLVLTKPLGTGILTSAVKSKKMKQTGLKPVIESMLMERDLYGCRVPGTVYDIGNPAGYRMCIKHIEKKGSIIKK